MKMFEGGNKQSIRCHDFERHVFLHILKSHVAFTASVSGPIYSLFVCLLNMLSRPSIILVDTKYSSSILTIIWPKKLTALKERRVNSWITVSWVKYEAS